MINQKNMKQIMAVALLLACMKGNTQDFKSFSMWNTQLTFNQRVNDLISRLTLEEKVKQMLNATPA